MWWVTTARPGCPENSGLGMPAGDTGGGSHLSASGPAGGAPGYRGHCRVGVVQRPGRPGGGITAVGGKSQAVDNEPG